MPCLVLSKRRDAKVIVLRRNIDDSEAAEIIERKKTAPFRSLLSRPKKEQVHVHSVELHYECVLMVSGRYVSDYYRKATHTLSVDHNVKNVAIGDGVFPVRSKSGLAKALSGRRGKNKIDLDLEEHVSVDVEDEIAFDHHGEVTEFAFKLDSGSVENYPDKVLEQNMENIKRPEMTHDEAIERLQELLSKPPESEVRDLHDEFTIGEIAEVYVPVYEARLVGPKKKIQILRLDAVRKKVL